MGAQQLQTEDAFDPTLGHLLPRLSSGSDVLPPLRSFSCLLVEFTRLPCHLFAPSCSAPPPGQARGPAHPRLRGRGHDEADETPRAGDPRVGRAAGGGACRAARGQTALPNRRRLAVPEQGRACSLLERGPGGPGTHGGPEAGIPSAGRRLCPSQAAEAGAVAHLTEARPCGPVGAGVLPGLLSGQTNLALAFLPDFLENCLPFGCCRSFLFFCFFLKL